MKYLLLLAALSCVPPHFDDNPKPANDAVWIPAGVVTDGLMQAAHVRWYIRAPADATIAFAARLPQWGGHHIIDSGFDFAFGAATSAIFGCIWRGIHHDLHCIR